MKKNWAMKSVEEISERVAMGPFGSSIKVSTFVDQGIPVISGQHLKESQLVDGENNFITEKHARKLEKANVFPGDVIFTHAGNIGQVAYIPDSARYKRYVISQRQFYCRPDLSQVLPQWIAAYFRSPDGRHSLLSNASSTGVPSIARPVTHLRSIKIPVPPLTEQKAITSILEVIEEKIQLNRQTARTLEELAQRLFKNWFVDFDPVRAKMVGRQPAHMPSETAAMFPCKLVDSPNGPIPEGWKTTDLAEMTKLNPESYSAKNLPGVIEYIDISSAADGECAGAATLSCDEAPSRARRIARAGDTVWSMVRPNRRAHFFYDGAFSESTVISTGFGIIRPRTAPCFFYYLTDHSVFSDYLERRATGAAYPAVNAKIFAEFPFVWPGEQLAAAFEEFVRPFKEKQATIRVENQTLNKLRDRLLPKLISGEIRLPEAQETAQEVAHD